MLRLFVVIAVLATAAGCLASEPSATTPTLPTQRASTTAVPVAFAGSLGAGAFACGPTGCVGDATSMSSQAPLPANGTVRSVELTLTWTAASPTTDNLRLGVSWNETGNHEFRTAEGPSPLKITLSGLAIRPDEEPYLWVFVPETQGAPAYMFAPQDFKVGGTLVEDA